MQLSWIDADNFRELAAKLQDAPPVIVPEPRGIPAAAHDPLLQEDIQVPEMEAPGQRSQNDCQLTRIREQLQSIRDRAVKAGLLHSANADAPEAAKSPSLTPGPTVEFPQEDIAKTSPPAAPASPEVAIEPAPMPDLPATMASPAATVDDMSARLTVFAQGVANLTHCEEIVLVDKQGGMLWSNSRNPELAISATIALTAALNDASQGAIIRPGVIRNRLSHDIELSMLPCSTKHGTVILTLSNARTLPYENVNLIRSALTQAIEGG